MNVSSESWRVCGRGLELESRASAVCDAAQSELYIRRRLSCKLAPCQFFSAIFLGPAIFLPFLQGEPPSLHPSSMGDGGIGASSEDSSSSEQCMIRLQQVWQAMRAD